MSFYMVLPSNSCPDTQPNNNASKYIVDYTNSIDLRGDWQVALTDVMIYYSPATIRKESYIKYLKAKIEDIVETVTITRSNVGFVVVYDDTGHWISTILSDGREIFVNSQHYVMFHFDKVDNKLYMKSMYPCEIVFPTFTTADYWGFSLKSKSAVKLDNYYGLNSDYPITSKEITKTPLEIKVKVIHKPEWLTHKISEAVFFDSSEKVVKHLTTTCGNVFKNITVTKNILSFTFKEDVTEAIFDTHLAMVLGFTKTKFKDSKNTGVFPIKLNNAFNQMYIYASVVEPIMVGSHRVPLLGCVWVDSTEHKYGDPISIEPVKPMYLPVSSESINNIEVNICDDSGRPIVSSLGSKTILTLHFKQVHN